MDVAEHALELFKRMNAQFADSQRQLDSVPARLSSLEQHHATVTGDIAHIRVELTDIRTDVERIKRRLDLVEV